MRLKFKIIVIISNDKKRVSPIKPGIGRGHPTPEHMPININRNLYTS